MEYIKDDISPNTEDLCLVKIKQALFRAHETEAKREELLQKYIKDLEWYLRIKKYLMSVDRTDQELAKEYFESRERYKELDKDYGLIGQRGPDKFEEGVFLLFIQSTKTLNLISGAEEKLKLND